MIWRFLILTLTLLGVYGPLLCQEAASDRQIKQYLLRDSHSFSAIRHSFQLGNYRNDEALGILDEIENAPDIKALKTACQKINFSLNKNPEFGPSEVQQQYRQLGEELQSNRDYNQDLHITKLKFTYKTAYFLHFYYLYYAKNSVLDLNPNYGRSVYIDLANGKTPGILNITAQERNKVPLIEHQSGGDEIKEELEKTVEQAKDALPFGYYGLIPLILTLLGLIYRFFRPHTNKSEQKKEIFVKIKHVEILPSQEKNKEQPKTKELLPYDKYEIDDLNVIETANQVLSTAIEYLYAELPHGNYFYKISKKPSAFTTFFTLQINPQNPLEAKFELTNDAQELKHIIETNFQLLQRTCEIPMGRRISSPADIKVEQPGLAVKTDEECWHIKEKIKLA